MEIWNHGEKKETRKAILLLTYIADVSCLTNRSFYMRTLSLTREFFIQYFSTDAIFINFNVFFFSLCQGEEDDEEAKETEEDQDGFFVPHGYLSDDEGVPDDDDSDNEENETTEKAPVSKEVADAKRVFL